MFTYDPNSSSDPSMMQHFVMTQAMTVVSDALIIGNADEQGCPIIYVNNRLLEYIDESSLSVLGSPMEDVLKKISSDSLVQEMWSDLWSEKTGKNVQVSRKKDRDVSWIDFKLRFGDKLGNMPRLLIGSISDITNEKRMQMQSAQNQKLEALGQLAGGVAHDFNNIMSIIDGYARIAEQGVNPGGREAQALKKIMKSVQRGAALTGQLLTYGRHNIVVETVIDLGAELEEQKALLQPLMNESIELEVYSSEDLFVECTPDFVSQILMNLCVNARDAMPDGGCLTIGACRVTREDMLEKEGPKKNMSEEYICLSVSDTGKGIEAEVMSRMFDPFFTTKGQAEGAGLGLSIVYGLVEQVHGTVRVESEPAVGTTFSIYLPLSKKRPVKKSIQLDEDPSRVRFDGYTTLVAEDEEDLREVIVQMLEAMGMNVLKAANGDEALLLQEDYKGKIDFLLTDVVMPKLNGVRLSHLFESLRPETKTVFMSGYPANTDNVRIELPDGAFLIPKPIEYAKLTRALTEMGNLKEKAKSDPLQRMAGL